jgi:hypothetical protein
MPHRREDDERRGLAVVPSHENGLFLYLSHFIFY